MDTEVLEQCDLGERNGTPDGCCPTRCTVQLPGVECHADDNPCTSDFCDGRAVVCSTAPRAGACDDGLFCNGADQCADGACSAHAGSPCPDADGDGDCRESCDEAADRCDAADPLGSACLVDSNPCTADSCDAHGSCLAVARTGSCDDGDACTIGDACVGGLCGAGGPTCDACQACGAAGVCAGPSCTPSPSPTALPPSSPTPPAACAGDCPADGTVAIDELVTLVGLALGSAEPANCRRGDTNGDGAIGIAELVAAVSALLHGCAPSA